jgi:hypothetical protein
MQLTSLAPGGRSRPPPVRPLTTPFAVRATRAPTKTATNWMAAPGSTLICTGALTLESSGS